MTISLKEWKEREKRKSISYRKIQKTKESKRDPITESGKPRC